MESNEFASLVPLALARAASPMLAAPATRGGSLRCRRSCGSAPGCVAVRCALGRSPHGGGPALAASCRHTRAFPVPRPAHGGSRPRRTRCARTAPLANDTWLVVGGVAPGPSRPLGRCSPVRSGLAPGAPSSGASGAGLGGHRPAGGLTAHTRVVARPGLALGRWCGPDQVLFAQPVLRHWRAAWPLRPGRRPPSGLPPAVRCILFTVSRPSKRALRARP